MSSCMKEFVGEKQSCHVFGGLGGVGWGGGGGRRGGGNHGISFQNDLPNYSNI